MEGSGEPMPEVQLGISKKVQRRSAWLFLTHLENGLRLLIRYSLNRALTDTGEAIKTSKFRTFRQAGKAARYFHTNLLTKISIYALATIIKKSGRNWRRVGYCRIFFGAGMKIIIHTSYGYAKYHLPEHQPYHHQYEPSDFISKNNS